MSDKKKKRRAHRPPPVTEPQRTEILRLSSEVKQGQRQVAKSLGLTRRQVRTVLESAQPEKKEEKPASLLDPFLLAIAERVEKGITTTRILREITEDGYHGGRTILSEHVRTLRPKRVPRRELPKRRFETPKGQEAQSDFGTYVVPIGGVSTTVQAFLSELAWSRKASIDVYRDQKRSTVFEAIDQAARDFEGCPAHWVIDNMTSIVLGQTEPEPGKRRPILHPDALSYGSQR